MSLSLSLLSKELGLSRSSKSILLTIRGRASIATSRRGFKDNVITSYITSYNRGDLGITTSSRGLVSIGFLTSYFPLFTITITFI